MGFGRRFVKGKKHQRGITAVPIPPFGAREADRYDGRKELVEISLIVPTPALVGPLRDERHFPLCPAPNGPAV